LNVSRVIRRKNEENLWTSWQRSFGLERVSQAGELSGVEEIRLRRLREIKRLLPPDQSRDLLKKDEKRTVTNNHDRRGLISTN